MHITSIINVYNYRLHYYYCLQRAKIENSNKMRLYLMSKPPIICLYIFTIALFPHHHDNVIFHACFSPELLKHIYKNCSFMKYILLLLQWCWRWWWGLYYVFSFPHEHHDCGWDDDNYVVVLFVFHNHYVNVCMKQFRIPLYDSYAAPPKILPTEHRRNSMTT